MEEYEELRGTEQRVNETDDRREVIKQKLRQYYDGRIVRKDLTKSIREGANVPVYVLEYLLGQYCNSDDQEIIDEGVENVKRILRDNYVRLMKRRRYYRCYARGAVILL
jgi:ATP-dependent Lon protease